ncbi:hypothetical protein [Pseudonocardia sp. T1-2H]|uniref:hypothetical protein n=1 Tax=Pseudonocardia sp. T1-2H TaxID=3128899 RepID=UPI003100D700
MREEDQLGAAMVRLSAGLEFGTGLALLAVPSVVIKLLIGPPAAERLALIGRVFGGALVALGVAGLLADGEPPTRGVVCAFTSYNASTAAILGAAGASEAADGVLLWPVVVFHAGAAAALAPHALRARPATRARLFLRRSPR